MKDKLSIKVNIANRVYPMTIAWEEEEAIREAVKRIEVKIKEFEDKYAVKDKQDVLAMCALQFVHLLVNREKEAEKSVDISLDLLNSLDEKLDAHFNDR